MEFSQSGLRFFLGLSYVIAGIYACGYPGSPPHSNVTFNTKKIQTGTVVSYHCEPGFDLLGPSRRLCLENGTWIPPGIPICVLDVARGKASMQSSINKDGTSQKAALDGNYDSCTLLRNETNPWWYVNLLEPFTVQFVRVDFGKSCCGNTSSPTIIVRVGNNRPDISENIECNRLTQSIEKGRPLYFPCSSPVKGAFVSIHTENSLPFVLSICEAHVYTDETLSPHHCPKFDEENVSPYNGKCYAFHSLVPRTFEDAKKHCNMNHGNLISDTSPALQGFLSWELYKRQRKFNAIDYWNGVIWHSDEKEYKSGWKWYDGREITVSFWSSSPIVKNCSKFNGNNGWLWTGSMCDDKYNFICQHLPTSCGYPGIPPNATITSQMSQQGKTIIAYRCSAGNLLVGSATLLCTDTGFYNDLPPTCIYLECGNPAIILNGNYTLLNGTSSYKSIVKYSCFEGYIMVGREVLICESDKKWDGPPPHCDPLMCHEPPPIEFGNVTLMISDLSGTVAEYSCHKGFYLEGQKKVSCTSEQVWTKDLPVCKVDRSKVLNARSEGKHRRNRSSISARLNMGGIISLGIFGGFVFLAVVISIVVIIIRRSSNSEDSGNSISTHGTGDSCERLYEQNTCYEHSAIGDHDLNGAVR